MASKIELRNSVWTERSVALFVLYLKKCGIPATWRQFVSAEVALMNPQSAYAYCRVSVAKSHAKRAEVLHDAWRAAQECLEFEREPKYHMHGTAFHLGLDSAIDLVDAGLLDSNLLPKAAS